MNTTEQIEHYEKLKAEASGGEMKNPKEVRQQLENKTPYEFVPVTGDKETAIVFKHGAEKYGRFNWRQTGVKGSTYIASIRRHWEAFSSGEDIDPDSGQPHLAHIIANCKIALDAKKFDKFIDDRNDVEVLND